MAKHSAIELARDMIRGQDARVISPKQADFLRDVCAREMANLERRKYRHWQKHGGPNGAPGPGRTKPPVASVGDPVWRHGDAYYVHDRDSGETYCVPRPWANGWCRIASVDG